MITRILRLNGIWSRALTTHVPARCQDRRQRTYESLTVSLAALHEWSMTVDILLSPLETSTLCYLIGSA